MAINLLYEEVSDGRDSSPVQSGVSSADSAAIALQTGESPDTSFGKGNAEKLPDDSFTEEDYVADKGFPPSKIKEELERFSIIRTVAAVERADVVVVVIDAAEGVTEQDAKIAGIAHDRGRGIIIAVNKWDSIEKDDKTIYKHTAKIREILSFIPYAEILFISAKTGQRVTKLFHIVENVIQNQNLRIQTGVCLLYTSPSPRDA